jgi:hypothetical protein
LTVLLNLKYTRSILKYDMSIILGCKQYGCTPDDVVISREIYRVYMNVNLTKSLSPRTFNDIRQLQIIITSVRMITEGVSGLMSGTLRVTAQVSGPFCSQNFASTI